MVMAEDDHDDQLLAKEALERSKLSHQMVTVDDGQALMDYLEDQIKIKRAKRPDLILLDLNLPRLDGIQVLERLKKDEQYRRIPVVILTTSRADEDVTRCYDMGVGGFFTKPVTFDGLVTIIKSIDQYWFTTVKLPSE